MSSTLVDFASGQRESGLRVDSALSVSKRILSARLIFALRSVTAMWRFLDFSFECPCCGSTNNRANKAVPAMSKEDAESKISSDADTMKCDQCGKVCIVRLTFRRNDPMPSK